MIQLVDNELGTLPLTCESGYVVTSFQIVGTAPAADTRSFSIIDTSGSACRKRSGMMMLAPLISAA